MVADHKYHPEGRQSFTYLNEKGRVVRTEVPGLAPVSFEYDERGRLITITEGEGIDTRVKDDQFYNYYTIIERGKKRLQELLINHSGVN